MKIFKGTLVKKLLFVFGTRPEAVKMAPVIIEAKNQGYDVKICLSGQHKDMVVSFMDFFKLKKDHDLNVMKSNQSLSELTANILTGMKKVLDLERPDMVLVQGDTTTTFAGALAAFLEKIPVAHIEAGLRTYNKYSPFPEEINRQMVSTFAELNFPPTEETKKNLLGERQNSHFVVTGNTSIDALRMARDLIDENKFREKYSQVDFTKKIVLVTTHRRENHGAPLLDICCALKKMHAEFDTQIILPVHLNPNVKSVIEQELKNVAGIHLLEPLDYPDFVFFMKQSYLIMTDSGGVQEEGPYFGKPILVMRENTERPEGIAAGTSILVGTKFEKVFSTLTELFNNSEKYNVFKKVTNPYGNGFASQKILKEIATFFQRHS